METSLAGLQLTGLAYDEPGLGALLGPLPDKDRQAALELACGVICKHTFYAAPRPDTSAKIDEPDMVPFFFPRKFGKQLHQQLKNTAPNSRLTINGPGGTIVEVTVGSYTAGVVGQIDGRRTLPEIAREVRRNHPARPSRNGVVAELKRLYARLGAWDLLLLRHASIPWA